MTLERDRHGSGRAVPVLRHDQVRLTGSRRLSLVRILTVQQDHNVRVLFDAIMDIDSISYKIMCFENGRIVNWLISDAFDRCDRIPEYIARSEHF